MLRGQFPQKYLAGTDLTDELVLLQFVDSC